MTLFNLAVCISLTLCSDLGNDCSGSYLADEDARLIAFLYTTITTAIMERISNFSPHHGTTQLQLRDEKNDSYINEVCAFFK